MKTLLGTEVPKTTRGIVYLCHFDYLKMEITVTKEILCNDSFIALTLYAEIPNSESQLVTSRTFEGLNYELDLLHTNMKDPVWLKELSEQL